MAKYLPEFDYIAPKSLAEAMEILHARVQAVGKTMAGGTDLVMAMREKELRPNYVVSLKNLGHDLEYVRLDPGSGTLRIGALTTVRSMETSALPDGRIQLLGEAASQLGSYQVRNRATLGGNICNASPAADLVPPLMVLEASLVLASSKGERSISIGDFFTGPGRTKIAKDEILKEIVVREMKGSWGASFIKISKRANALAVVNAATLVEIEGNTLRDVRISFGAVAPTPVRAGNVEKALRGASLSSLDLSKVHGELDRDIKPISDLRAGEAYRRHLAWVLLKRSLAASIGRAKHGK